MGGSWPPFLLSKIFAFWLVYIMSNQIESARVPAFNIPAIIIIFMTAFAAIHFYRENLSGIADSNLLFQFGFIPKLFFSDVKYTNLSIWFSVVTYAFLHGSWAHLILNSLWFVAFGSVVARSLGAGLFIVFFTLTAIFSAIVYGMLHPDLLSPLIGASGSVSGAMAAALMMVPIVDTGNFRLLPLKEALQERRVQATIGIWVLINIFSGIGINPSMVNETAQIAWEAHLAGFFCGLVLIGFMHKLRGHPNS